MRKTVEKVLDVLANLGFVMRDTRRGKVTAGRQWGAEADGFVLSIHLVKPVPTLSVALMNKLSEERRATLPDWLFYYSAKVVAPDGSDARLTPFGRQLLSGEQGIKTREVIFPPGEPVITEIPVATLYDMRTPGQYRVSVSCRSPGNQEILTSNELNILVKAI